jgi:flagellar protein FlgJ
MSSIESISQAQSLPLLQSMAESFDPKTNPRSPEKVASDFESVFTSMMLKEMRKTLESGSLFGEDTSDIYGGMFDQFLGQHMVDSGGIGLARMFREAIERSSKLE